LCFSPGGVRAEFFTDLEFFETIEKKSTSMVHSRAELPTGTYSQCGKLDSGGYPPQVFCAVCRKFSVKQANEVRHAVNVLLAKR
jgi:hypothetical protein